MTSEAVPSAQLPRIAVLGAGHTGPIIARVAIEAGYQVSIAASGDPANIELITQVLAPGAKPRWAADAAEEADMVVMAIPLDKFATFDPALVAGKLVVDTMNYWPAIDGVQQMFEDRRYGSSEIVAHQLARSTIVKTLNHIGYHELDDERRPVGAPDRRALGVASDDPGAVGVVAELTFGDLTHDENDRPQSHAQTIRNVVAQGVLADQVAWTTLGSVNTTPTTSRCRPRTWCSARSPRAQPASTSDRP